MNVFVSGATGFIGGHLVERLVADGHTVRVLARPTSDLSLLRRLGVDVALGDIAEYRDVRPVMAGCEVGFHAARARLGETRCRSVYRDVNLAGTENVCRGAAESGLRRLVHCSTISVHGRPADVPVDERSPCRPSSAHGRTKLEAERVVRRYAEEGRFTAVIARLTAVMGPRALAWRRFFLSVLEGRWTLLGGRNPHFHVTDVEDVVEGLLICAERGDESGADTYLIGADEVHRLNDVARMVAEEGDVEFRCRRLPLTPAVWAAAVTRVALRPLGVEPGVVHQVDFLTRQRFADVTKAKSELGFQPRRSARDAVRRTLAWYRANGHV